MHGKRKAADHRDLRIVAAQHTQDLERVEAHRETRFAAASASAARESSAQRRNRCALLIARWRAICSEELQVRCALRARRGPDLPRTRAGHAYEIRLAVNGPGATLPLIG